MAMHFIERYNLMAIKITSKFELRRFCRATNATGVVYNLYAAHANGETAAGVDVTHEAQWCDLQAKESIADVYLVKWWALKLATEAVCTVLRVDQIIMAKQAGGPKGGGPGGDED